MSWMAGIGRGLESLGQGVANWGVARQTREDRLQQQALENALAEQRLKIESDRQQAEDARRLREDTERREDNERLLAFGLADRYGGQELTDSSIEAIPPKYRDLLTERRPGTMVGDRSLQGFSGPVGATPIETEIESGPDVRKFKTPQTDAYRRTLLQTESRNRAAEMRNRFLYDKLAQDRELAEMVNQLGIDRVQQAWKMHGDRMGLGFAGLDARYDFEEANRQLEIFKADMRLLAAEQGGNSMQTFMQGLLNGRPGAGSAAPQAPQTQRPVPPPAVPPRKGRRPEAGSGGGAANPPATDPTNPEGLLRPRR